MKEEDWKIYCIGCGKEIKECGFWIPLKIKNGMLGTCHRNCKNERRKSN